MVPNQEDKGLEVCEEPSPGVLGGTPSIARESKLDYLVEVEGDDWMV